MTGPTFKEGSDAWRKAHDARLEPDDRDVEPCTECPCPEPEVQMEDCDKCECHRKM